MKSVRLLQELVVFTAFTPFAMADYDVSPKVVGGQIVVNAFFDAEEVEFENVAVFGYSFGEDVILPPNELSDPGFHPLPGSGFAEGSQLGVDAQSVLQYWNGLGTPAFTAASGSTAIGYAFGSSAASVNGTTIPAIDVLLGPVDANGEFDDHLDTDITLAALAGIYLLSAEVNSSMSNVTPSREIYFLFNYGDDEETLDTAVEFIRDTFAPGTAIPVVPEPAALGTLACCTMAMLRRRR